MPQIKLFSQNELRGAAEHSEAGGIALHVWEPPEAFRRLSHPTFRRASLWGHLFCKDSVELVRLAKRFGVRKVYIHRQRVRAQHVDLCGKPLERAIEAAKVMDE